MRVTIISHDCGIFLIWEGAQTKLLVFKFLKSHNVIWETIYSPGSLSNYENIFLIQNTNQHELYTEALEVNKTVYL